MRFEKKVSLIGFVQTSKRAFIDKTTYKFDIKTACPRKLTLSLITQMKTKKQSSHGL